MFYTKATLTDTVEVKVELNDENVFCTCPDCGDEVCVDLSEVFADGIDEERFRERGGKGRLADALAPVGDHL